MSAIDVKLRQICKEVIRSSTFQRWCCPQCGTLLDISFYSFFSERLNRKSSSLSIKCDVCGLRDETDGDFDIPTWYQNP